MTDHAATDCPCISFSGDEGPIVDLGRMPVRWRCDECGQLEEPAMVDPEAPQQIIEGSGYRIPMRQLSNISVSASAYAKELECALEEEVANRDEWQSKLDHVIYSLASVEEIGEWSSLNDPAERFIEYMQKRLASNG